MFGILISEITDFDTDLPTGEAIVISPHSVIALVKNRFKCDTSLSQRGMRHWWHDQITLSYQREGMRTQYELKGW